jgi:DNA-binding transcriptional regulator YdaS (Cro superfamily)
LKKSAAGRVTKAKKSTEPKAQRVTKVRVEEQAAQVMWEYYRDNRANLIEHIKEFRKEILAGLIAGNAPADVFAPYFIKEDLAKTKRRKVAADIPAQEPAKSGPVSLSDLKPRVVNGTKF